MKKILKVILSSLPLIALLACENSKSSSLSKLESSSKEESSIIEESKSSEFDSSISEAITSSSMATSSSSLEEVISSSSPSSSSVESSEVIIKTYTVTWTNFDGTVLKTDTDVIEGSTPSFDGADPARENDDTYSYTFTGWTPNIEPVSKDITYTATYSSSELPHYYEVRFLNYDYSVLYETYVLEGTDAVYSGETPTREEDDEFSYEFDGWDEDISNITHDMTTMAVYKYTAKEDWGEIIWF